MTPYPAIAIVELDSVATGTTAGDAMVKAAPIDRIHAGTIHRGKYLVLVGGDTASVEESYAAGLAVGNDVLIDRIILPSAHPEVVRYLRGMRGRVTGEALGIVETTTVAVPEEVLKAGFHHGASYYQHLDFQRAVREGTPAKVSARDGLMGVAIGVAAQLSIEEGRPVAMSELGV